MKGKYMGACTVEICVKDQTLNSCSFSFTDNTEDVLVVAKDIMSHIGIDIADCNYLEYKKQDTL